MECLFRFFSYGLEKKFRPEVYKDFQTQTLKDHESGQMYGLEKFWAFLHYYKHADELYVQPKLKKILEDFKSIDDFKVLYTVSTILYSSRPLLVIGCGTSSVNFQPLGIQIASPVFQNCSSERCKSVAS